MAISNFSRTDGRKAAGYTLTEVAVAVGLLGIFGLIVAQSTLSLLDGLNRASLDLTRDTLLTYLRKTAGNHASLKRSKNQPGNTILNTCLCGVGCETGKISEIELFDNGGTKVAGTLASPAFQDIQGRVCDGSKPNCLFRITTKILPQCPPPPLPVLNPSPLKVCVGPAEYFSIIATIDQNPTSIGHAMSVRSVTTRVYTQVADYLNASTGGCP